MADDTLTLALDASDFHEGLARADAGHERLIGSAHRAAGRIGHLSEQMYQGAGAGKLFSNSILAIEQTLNLPLSSLGILAGVGYLAKEIFATTEEAKKLHDAIEEISRAGKQSPRFETLEELNKQLSESEKKLKELQAVGEAGFFKTALSYIGSAHLLGGSGFDAVLAQRREDEIKLRTTIDREKAGVAEKKADENEILATKETSGEFESERLKISKKRDEQTAGALDNPALLAQIHREADLELAAIDKKEAAKLREADLEKKIADIKIGGRNVDELTAKAKLEAATEEAHHATHSEIPKAEAKIHAAEAEVIGVDRKSAEKLAEIALEEKLTGIKESGKNVEVESARAKIDAAEKALSLAQTDEETEKATHDLAKSKGELADAQRKEEKTHRDEGRKKAEEAVRDKETAEKRAIHDEERRLNPAGLTLEDYAKSNIIGAAGGSAAREAIREQELAKRLQLAGALPEAAEHQNRAEQLKKSLGLPNEIDREKHFQDALDKSETLKAIRDNTKDMTANK